MAAELLLKHWGCFAPISMGFQSVRVSLCLCCGIIRYGDNSKSRKV